MIDVDARTHSTIWGLVVLILGAGWIAYGLLGSGNTVFLAIMLILTIVFSAGAAFFVRTVRGN
jgi:multisubunit Na+/H+ antiporter MnhG subunit